MKIVDWFRAGRAQLKEELERKYRGRVDFLESQVRGLQDDVESRDKRIDDLHTRIQSLIDQNNALTMQFGQVQLELAKANSKIRYLEESMKPNGD